MNLFRWDIHRKIWKEIGINIGLSLVTCVGMAIVIAIIFGIGWLFYVMPTWLQVTSLSIFIVSVAYFMGYVHLLNKEKAEKAHDQHSIRID